MDTVVANVRVVTVLYYEGLSGLSVRRSALHDVKKKEHRVQFCNEFRSGKSIFAVMEGDVRLYKIPGVLSSSVDDDFVSGSGMADVTVLFYDESNDEFDSSIYHELLMDVEYVNGQIMLPATFMSSKTVVAVVEQSTVLNSLSDRAEARDAPPYAAGSNEAIA
jgi:hypothetical protein